MGLDSRGLSAPPPHPRQTRAVLPKEDRDQLRPGCPPQGAQNGLLARHSSGRVEVEVVAGSEVAGCLMLANLAGFQFGHVHITHPFLGDWAPGMEVATRRGIDGGGDFTLKNCSIPRAARVRYRNSRQQGLGVGMERPGV